MRERKREREREIDGGGWREGEHYSDRSREGEREG